MSQDPELLVRLEKGVLWLTLNRPARRNALSLPLYEALLDALERAAVDDDVGAVVLSGTGAAFCAGGDVARMNAQSTPAQEPLQPASSAARVAVMRNRTRIVELLHQMPKPTIAMVRGPAVGAGLSLALACDLRYGDETARMRTGFINAGVSGDFGVHYFLPRIVGAAKARELCLLSPMVAAPQAKELGMINAIFASGSLLQEVTHLAQALATGPQPAIHHLLMNLNDGLRMSLAQVLDEECARHVDCADSADHREAASAFMQKRLPIFKRTHDSDAGKGKDVQSNKQEL